MAELAVGWGCGRKLYRWRNGRMPAEGEAEDSAPDLRRESHGEELVA